MNSDFIQPGFNHQKKKPKKKTQKNKRDIRVCSRLRRGGLKSEHSDGPFGCFWSLHFQSLEDQMQFSDCVFRATTSFRQRDFFCVFCCAQTMRNFRGPHLLDHSENRPTSLGIRIPERKRGRNGEYNDLLNTRMF